VSIRVHTAAKNQRARLSIHWKVSQLHRAFGLYCQSETRAKATQINNNDKTAFWYRNLVSVWTLNVVFESGITQNKSYGDLLSQILFLGLCTVDSIADVSEVPAVYIVKVEVRMVGRLITFPYTHFIGPGPGISPSTSTGGPVLVSGKLLLVIASTVILTQDS
jgi:hypothetical protein